MGVSDYDEHVLRPFEKFLHASFSEYRNILKFLHLYLSFVDKEDCAARALQKTESVSDMESEVEDDEEGKEVGAQVGQLSEYARRREENIAKNKSILEKLFPTSEDLLPKPKLKSVPKLKASEKGSEVLPRRESQRLQQLEGKQ